jgi:hypothetical protein
MTLEKARQLLETQISFGGGYNRNGAKLIIADVIREHGQQAADQPDPRPAPGTSSSASVRAKRRENLHPFRQPRPRSDDGAAVSIAMDEGAEAVIHCGDIIGGNTLRASIKLGLPIHVIHGNNLGDFPRSPASPTRSDGMLIYHGGDASIQLGGRRIFLTHYPHSATAWPAPAITTWSAAATATSRNEAPAQHPRHQHLADQSGHRRRARCAHGDLDHGRPGDNGIRNPRLRRRRARPERNTPRW